MAVHFLSGRTLAAAFLALSSATEAVAADPAPLPAAASATEHGWKELEPGHLLCSTAAGRYANRDILSLQPGRPVTFRFRLVSENHDPAWTVNAALLFDTPGEHTRIEIGKAQNDRSHIYVAVRGAQGSAAKWRVLDAFPVDAGWIEVQTELDRHGTLKVRSRSKRASLDLGAVQPVKAQLHCNSGVFEVTVMPATQAESPAPHG